MSGIKRRTFLTQASLIGLQISLLPSCGLRPSPLVEATVAKGLVLKTAKSGEDIFAYIRRTKGGFDHRFYQQIIGAANDFKEGDQAIGVSAEDQQTRTYARVLLANTKLKELEQHPLFQDEIFELIQETTAYNERLQNWTIGELKQFILSASEAEIKSIMPALTSDTIACAVKLMSNEELIQVGQKIFNPLPGTQIGSKGYMSARIQPNSPTDNVDDIIWQVFDAWSYAVGDLVLGTNPVSSEPQSVVAIEKALYELLQVFQLEETLPNCVLSHIDIQAEVEQLHAGTTGIWFQSLAGTVGANQTFDVTIQKMQAHAAQRQGAYGMYFETGQGADFTNGHGQGFDMLVHESRKYGFIRALKQQISEQIGEEAWVHVNDVAGFIGPEVFKSKEQLVRCCLEDTVMGKLHGLCIGLDICSTLHMDVSLQDLDWCIDQVMPANPAYLMALPTKNDPMLSYLTTSFSDHVRVREKFGYKINDAMWAFFKKLDIIGTDNRPTEHFGDPIWVYYQYQKTKGDTRSKSLIYQEGQKKIAAIQERGVPIAQGYGKAYWNLPPELAQKVQHLYEDAKLSIWTEVDQNFTRAIPSTLLLHTQSEDRKDYIYHPESGEKLSDKSVRQLYRFKQSWNGRSPDVQIIISDGLNARALMDEGHLLPYLESLKNGLTTKGYLVSEQILFLHHGRVRAGYACGEQLFGDASRPNKNKGIIHIIGERPGSGHHNFSAYLTAATGNIWAQKGQVDHDITRVISGISDTALLPKIAAKETLMIFEKLFPVLS